jgi:hypothetical protein
VGQSPTDNNMRKKADDVVEIRQQATTVEHVARAIVTC